MDDSVRHAISRLSSLFATSTLEAKNFLIDSREEEWRVFHCGLLSYSNLSSHNIVNPVGSAATWLNKYLRKPLFICTMHSVPQLKDKGQMQELL